MGPSSPRLPPGPGAALRRRLAIPLGSVAGARPVRLSGGRSAATIRLGQCPGAMVIKMTHAPRVATTALATGSETVLSSVEPTGTTRTSVPPTAPTDGLHATPSGTTRAGSPLFPVDPVLEAHLMKALAPRGLAPTPTALFRHGPHICLAYPYQHGRAGQPPDHALGRVLRQLHGLPPTALPPLRAPQDRTELLARARHRLRQHPEGWALVARIDAAADAARAPAPRGPVPLHGDPVPGNVLRGPRGARLIDWHSAHWGDPCHDLALALSPAMQVIHGLPPCTPRQRAAVLAGYGCRATADRLSATAALHHALMIGHCLWRLDQGDNAYGPACRAEIEALRDAA